VIALFVQADLEATHGTLDNLRAYIAMRSIPRYREMPGLRLKIYLSDASADQFGAVYVFEDAGSLEAALPSLGSSIRDASGHAPRYQRFDVEAIIEGRHTTPDLCFIPAAAATA
jgi:hypothetical protein